MQYVGRLQEEHPPSEFDTLQDFPLKEVVPKYNLRSPIHRMLSCIATVPAVATYALVEATT